MSVCAHSKRPRHWLLVYCIHIHIYIETNVSQPPEDTPVQRKKLSTPTPPFLLNFVLEGVLSMLSDFREPPFPPMPLPHQGGVGHPSWLN